MNVILSIKPEYANKILDGSKKFEFRKASFSSQRVECVLMYATKPVGKVVGEFRVSHIHVDKPSAIWKMAKVHAGINKRFFDEYYRDREVAVAIEVESVRKYETPIGLSELGAGITAPQSFRYLPSHPERQLALPL